MDELPTTERRNQASMRLDEMPVEAIVRLMNDEERRVQEAVTEALPRIASAVEVLVEAWREGGVGSTSAQEPAAVSPRSTQPSVPPPSGCHRTAYWRSSPAGRMPLLAPSRTTARPPSATSKSSASVRTTSWSDSPRAAARLTSWPPSGRPPKRGAPP